MKMGKILLASRLSFVLAPQFSDVWHIVSLLTGYL